MREEWVRKRIGEWEEPIDWDFPFESFDWNHGGSCNPDCVRAGIEALKMVAEDPTGWRYAPSGFTSFEVVRVGMYDGWPYWRPTPALAYIGPLGLEEVAFFNTLRKYLLVRTKGARR